RVVFADGRAAAPVTRALAGEGTVVRGDEDMAVRDEMVLASSLRAAIQEETR
ncbi:MAG: hypothetical protein H0U10_06330, partial [Chloroflexia bacterium]|nr:hypothetical protein [Chloroflexia bacterium]